MIDRRTIAVACAAELALHNGQDAVALDLSELHAWTDFFVIVSATSTTHLRGLARQVLDFCAANEVETLRRPHIADDEEWVLVDCGFLVIHIMSERAREFYELEKLWFQAQKLELPAPIATKAMSSGDASVAPKAPAVDS